MKCRILILFFMIVSGSIAYAESAADTVRVYFRYGYSVPDLSYRNNRRALDDFISRLTSPASDNTRHVVRFCVVGNSSPSGSSEANQRLGEHRAANILEYIRARVAFPDSIVSVAAKGIDWEGLAAMVEKDLTIPARQQVLDILRNTPIWIYDEHGRIVDGRKKQLMNLKGGTVYRLLRERFFADLRNSSMLISYEVKNMPSLRISKTPVPADMLKRNKIPDRQVYAESAMPGRTRAWGPHRLALKSNMLYDVLLMPSLEVEYRINTRWSINLEGDMAWWHNAPAHKYYQLAIISPEGRYWLKSRSPWHGHYIGAFTGYGWYDLENGGRGYRGELEMIGASYGYMFPIGPNLSLEAGIGIGFMRAKSKEYLPMDGQYVYQQTDKTNYFGPLKLKFAIVWRLWRQHTKGGRR